MGNPLRVLDAARSVVGEVDELLDHSGGRILRDRQLRASVASIAANIREAYGRRAGPERNQFLRFARGSAEETDEHLRGNYLSGRINAALWWRLHHRLMTIVKMLNQLMTERKNPSSAPAVRVRRQRPL